MHEKSLFNDGGASFDPLDFEGSLKKKVLDPEQALMLALRAFLASASLLVCRSY
jgi:hypothetical protein